MSYANEIIQGISYNHHY